MHAWRVIVLDGPGVPLQHFESVGGRIPVKYHSTVSCQLFICVLESLR